MGRAEVRFWASSGREVCATTNSPIWTKTEQEVPGAAVAAVAVAAAVVAEEEDQAQIQNLVVETMASHTHPT